jgi:hypothetical protein
MPSPSRGAPPTPLPDLPGAASTYWLRKGLVTEDELPTYLQPLRLLIEQATRCDVPDLEALCACPAPVLLRLSGATSLTGEHDDTAAHHLHLYRNLAGTLCATDALQRGHDPGAALRPLPHLARRTWLRPGRPLEDDERLLLRLLVHHRWLTGSAQALLAATRYVLCEAGATPGETTTVTSADLDNPTWPTCVWAPGNRDRDRRSLPLNSWQSRILADHVKQRTAAGLSQQPLVIDGPRKNPTAYVQQALDGLLAKAGLDQLPDVTASSITFQAADRACVRHGDEAGFVLLGRRSVEQALRDLCRVGWEPSPGPAAVRSLLDNPFPTYQGRAAAHSPSRRSRH